MTFGIPAASRMPPGEGRLSPSFPSPPRARFALIGDEVTPERFAQPDGRPGTLVAAGRSPRYADRHGARRDSSFQEQTRRRRWARVDEQLECSRRKRPERRPVPRRACVHQTQRRRAERPGNDSPRIRLLLFPCRSTTFLSQVTTRRSMSLMEVRWCFAPDSKTRLGTALRTLLPPPNLHVPVCVCPR